MRLPARSIIPATIEIGLFRQTRGKVPVSPVTGIIQHVLIACVHAGIPVQ